MIENKINLPIFIEEGTKTGTGATFRESVEYERIKTSEW